MKVSAAFVHSVFFLFKKDLININRTGFRHSIRDGFKKTRSLAISSNSLSHHGFLSLLNYQFSFDLYNPSKSLLGILSVSPFGSLWSCHSCFLCLYWLFAHMGDQLSLSTLNDCFPEWLFPPNNLSSHVSLIFHFGFRSNRILTCSLWNFHCEWQ